MTKHIIYLFTVFLIVACSRYPVDVEWALKLAGENRSELEQAMEHYSKNPVDGLEMDVSQFLIGNMTAYFSYDTASLDFYRPVLPDMDSLIKVSGAAKTRLVARWDSLKRVYPLHVHVYGKTFRDIQNIKASYLIEDFDMATETWQTNPYRDSVSQKDFIEYILPYRKQNGVALENWRRFFHARHGSYLKERYPQPIITVIDSLMYMYKDYLHTGFTLTDFPYLNIGDLLTSNRSVCEYRCWFNVMLLSALGLSAAVDYVPYWGNFHGGHTWNTIQYGGTFYAFEPFWDEDRWKYRQLYNNVYSDDWTGKYRLPKVFRYSYRIHPEGPAFDKRMPREDIPDLFIMPNLMDVSQQYFATSDVEIRLDKPTNERYSYLCVYNNDLWEPVQWSVNRHGKARYQAMGRDIVYLPAHYRNKSVVPAGDPFLLKPDGNIYPLVASDSTETITVSQTFPERPYIAGFGRSLVGGILQGANQSDFADAEVLANVSIPDRISIVIDVNTSKSFRYVRFVFPDREVIPNRDGRNLLMAWGNIAELIFYNGSGHPLDGEMIFSFGLDYQNTLRALDNQPFTSMSPRLMYTIPLDSVVWIGRDLGVPANIARIEILPKNEDVFLFRDATYELLYWTEGDWRSLGIQKATNPELTFHHVPRRALLLLKALDLPPLKERPFLYENGEQVFY